MKKKFSLTSYLIAFLMPALFLAFTAEAKKEKPHKSHPTASSSSLQEISDKVLQADYAAALSLLDKKSEAEVQKDFRLQFLQGFLQLKNNSPATLETFEKLNVSKKDHAAVEDYVLYYTALSQVQSDKNDEAQKTFQQALTQSSSNYLQGLIQQELGQLHCRLGQKAEADEFFQKLLASSNASQKYRLGYQQALCWIALKDYSAAGKKLRELYTDHPEGQLRNEILALLQKSEIQAAPSASEHLALAQKLLQLGRPDVAAQEFSLAFRELTPSATQLQAWADAYFAARNYPESAKIYAKIKSEHPELFDFKMQENLARSYSRSDEFERAMSLYQDALSRDPHVDRQEFEYRLVFLQYDQALGLSENDKSRSEKIHQAIAQLEDYLQKYPKTSRKDEIAWKIAWSHYRLGELPKALEKLETFSASDRVQYWKARLYDKTGQKAKAQQLYQTLGADKNYYGFLSLKRLQQRWKAEDAPQKTGISPSAMHRGAPFAIGEGSGKKQRLNLLLQVGLWDHFSGELENLSREELTQAGLSEIASQIFNPPSVSVQDKRIDASAYPIAYENLVKYFSQGQSIPPQLSWAIAREESRFKPEIVSSADAIGLMQMIPPTASEVAAKIGRPNFQSEQLKTPRVNLEFGIYYLGSLVRQFNGNIIAAIAGYNGGPHNVERWLRDQNLDWDEFVEEIPYRETQDYVKKVLKSYYFYKLLYASPHE